MRVAPDAEKDRTVEVIPAPPRVVSVAAQSGYRLAVVFADGRSGVVDCRRLILGERAGVFAQLRDPAAFGAVRIEHGAVAWPGELDLAPDAMYDELSRGGVWMIE
jgi:hypothetical protein